MVAPVLGGEGPMSPSRAKLLGLYYLSLGQRGWSGESHCWASYGNLINLFTKAPTGLLSQAFCLSLTTDAPGVSGCLAELEGDSSPIHWALPPRANPQLLQEGRRGRAPGSLWRTGQVTCLRPCTHRLGSCSPSAAEPPAPRPRHRA